MIKHTIDIPERFFPIAQVEVKYAEQPNVCMYGYDGNEVYDMPEQLSATYLEAKDELVKSVAKYLLTTYIYLK